MVAENSNATAARSPWRDPWPWGVFAVALLLRLIYLLDLQHTAFFSHPQMDALYHDQWARRIAAGDWMGSEVFFRAPLYPYALGVFYAVFGTDYTLVRVVQLLIGSGTALLTTLLAYRRFGRRAAVAAGFLVAVYGPLIYFEGELLLVVLEAPANLAAAWALDRALRKRTLSAWGLAGALLGIGALVRPTLLAVAPVVVFYLLVRERGHGVRPAAVYTGIVLLVLSPVLVRNYVVGRDVVPVASQGGLNFYLGNNPSADGMAAVAPEFRRTWTGGRDDARRLAELALDRTLKPSEVSRYWFGRALDWARTDPVAFARLQLQKLGYFWNGFEIPNNQDYYFFSRQARIFRIPVLMTFYLLGPLALAGLVTGIRRKQIGFGWVVVPVVLMLVIAGFFVCGRFRASLVPLFAVWAAAGGWGAVDAWRGRQTRDLIVYLVVLVAAGWWVHADLAGLRERHSYAESHLRLGIFHAARSEEDDALRHYRAAIAEDPGFADGWNNLGVLHAQKGRWVEARVAFTTAIEKRPDHAKALGNLASLAFKEGRRVEADSLARRTVAVAAREPDALYNAAVVLGNLGDAETALAVFREILRVRPESSRGRVGEARALVVLGRPEEALKSLRSHPEARRTPELRELLRSLENRESP